MNNTKKNFIWNMVGSTVNAFTSLVFMIIVTRINGTNIAGIFTFSFSLACLFQVISNYSGRTFQVTNNDSKIKDSDFVYNRITSCIIMAIFLIIYLIIKDYDTYKNIMIILFAIYRIIESLAEVMYGIIQKNNELYKVGISLFLKGLLGTIVFLLVDYFTNNILMTLFFLIFTCIIITILYDYKNFKFFYSKNKYDSKVNIKLFKLGVFVFGFTFLTQYILNAPKYTIDDYLPNEMQTIYGIISMPASFIVLCSQFVIQPLLVKFSELIKNSKYRDLFKLSLKTILIIILLGSTATVAAYFLGIPVLNLIYGVELNDYLIPLLIIIVGATFFSISFAISTILTAMRKTFAQIIFYIICSLVVMFLSKYMVLKYSIIGGTISYATTMILLCIMYFIYYIIVIRRCIKNAKSISNSSSI